MVKTDPDGSHHRHLVIGENGDQFGGGVDVALVGGVSQVFGLDKAPQLLMTSRSSYALLTRITGSFTHNFVQPINRLRKLLRRGFTQLAAQALCG